MAKEDSPPVYTVPEWFVSAHFKTRQEIQTAESPLFLTGDQEQKASETNSEKDSDGTQDAKKSPKFAVSKRWLNSLRDAVAASFVMDSDELKPAFQPSILLHRLQDGARGCTDSIVHCLARELGAHLATVDLDALDELCWDFLEQNERRVLDSALDAAAEDDAAVEDPAAPGDPDEFDQDEANNSSTETDGSVQNSTPSVVSGIPAPRTDFDALDAEDRAHLAMFYFGTRSHWHATEEAQERTQAAMASLLHALQVKVEVAESAISKTSDKDHTEPPILLYVPDADAFEQLKTGRRFFTRLRDYIDTQRKHGQKLLMVLSVDSSGKSSFTGCQCDSCAEDLSYDWRRILYKLQINATSTFKVPWQSDGNIQTVAASQDEGKQARVRDANIRDLKLALRTHLPRRLHGAFLSRSAIWDFPANMEGLELLQSRDLTEEEIQKVVRQLTGRSWQKEAIDTEDIFVVLARLSDEWIPHSEEVIEDSEPDEDEAWKTKIRLIREDCDEFEEVILAGVVNPRELKSGYDSVIIDKKTKQLVAQLLALSVSRSNPKYHPLLGQLQSRGAMFYGPPGTGKTHLCRAIAKESSMVMLTIDGASVQSKWVGESEKLIKAAFTLAEKLHPCILFIDEVDSLFAQRNSDQKRWERAIVTQFLEEMDGLSSSEKAPFVIVATNRPADLDEAFIRRLPQKVSFSLPTLEQRKDIFKVFLKDEDLSDSVRLELLAAETEGFSGSDIRSLCGAAALEWSMEQLEIASTPCSEDEAPSLRLTSEHFQSAFERTMPSVSKQSMVDIERFEKRFSKKMPKKPKGFAMPQQGAFYDPRIGRQ